VQIPKPTEAGKERFRCAVPDDARVEVKPMFGNLGAFVNGNMFAGLFGDDIGVKLNPADHEALAAAGGGGFGPAERPMGGFLTVPESQPPELWLEKALGHVATLPPKKPRRK
jgi:hypothetical protein